MNLTTFFFPPLAIPEYTVQAKVHITKFILNLSVLAFWLLVLIICDNSSFLESSGLRSHPIFADCTIVCSATDCYSTWLLYCRLLLLNYLNVFSLWEIFMTLTCSYSVEIWFYWHTPAFFCHVIDQIIWDGSLHPSFINFWTQVIGIFLKWQWSHTSVQWWWFEESQWWRICTSELFLKAIVPFLLSWTLLNNPLLVAIIIKV